MKVSGLDEDGGNLRLKRIVHRVVGDLFRTIEEFDVQPDEFWAAMGYLTRLGQSGEVGLLVPGPRSGDASSTCAWTRRNRRPGSKAARRALSKGRCMSRVPRFRRVRLGWTTAASRATSCSWMARFGRGWQADRWRHRRCLARQHAGRLLVLRPAQPKYNLRRRIETDADGRYRFRLVLPSGYACPPAGPTQQLLDQLGRHGHRPAHIHFFVDSPGSSEADDADQHRRRRIPA